MDIFSGDPYLTLGPNGATLTYVGGQPRMDQGIENQIVISLFTVEGWEGNYLLPDPDQHVGSDFYETTKQVITLSLLNDIEKSAIRALASPLFGRVAVDVRNPEADFLIVKIRVEPPGQDARTLILSRNGINWQMQALNPANERI